MNRELFDYSIIIFMGIMLSVIIYLDWADFYTTFSLIPLAGFYYLGQYTERTFGPTNI
ncbi:hypothetical protein [Fodinibius halophilus]|uniref:Uncharacterized protein n=1 Tax=Fodinibius halophilus TaxID=1736908 RepID=A0A6M1TG45_9BACT|nr:hypothetical protein [Fodinibius halophilus]NGP89774.1 hypothetical protein [Fodinibius halophilus]